MAIHDRHEDRAMPKPLASHLASRDDSEHPILEVDLVDEFTRRIDFDHRSLPITRSAYDARMADPNDISTLTEESRDLLDDAISLRRSLHEWPELGNHLPRTRDEVLAALEGLPLGLTLHETTSGIVAALEGDHPGPTMLLRGAGQHRGVRVVATRVHGVLDARTEFDPGVLGHGKRVHVAA